VKELILAAAMTIVIDGDTLQHNGERVRLWGIDAPEMTTQAGAESKRALATIIGGRDLHCAARYRDRYGRVVAMCYIKGAARADIGNDVACAMVRLGAAKDWPRYSKGYYRQCDYANFK